MSKLILIRGLPGSGKTTLALSMVEENRDIFHIEADMFFLDEHGVYRFDRSRLRAAHDWCYTHATNHLRMGETVIVSNTFTLLQEMQPYIKYAMRHNIDWQIIVCRGEYPSIHNVPPETIARMKARWEDLDD